MKKQSTIWLFVLLVFLVPLSLFAFFRLYEQKLQKLPVISDTKEVKIDGLVDQDGKPFSASMWEGKMVVVDFFFSRCPTICPAMTKHMQDVQAAFAGDDDVLLTSISVDPEHDTPAQLKAHAKQRGLDTHNWYLVTGEKREIYRLARNGFKIVANDGDGGPADFIHSEKLVLLDNRQRIRGYYDGTSDAETDKLINDLKKLRNEK